MDLLDIISKGLFDLFHQERHTQFLTEFWLYYPLPLKLCNAINLTIEMERRFLLHLFHKARHTMASYDIMK